MKGGGRRRCRVKRVGSRVGVSRHCSWHHRCCRIERVTPGLWVNVGFRCWHGESRIQIRPCFWVRSLHRTRPRNCGRLEGKRRPAWLGRGLIHRGGRILVRQARQGTLRGPARYTKGSRTRFRTLVRLSCEGETRRVNLTRAIGVGCRVVNLFRCCESWVSLPILTSKRFSKGNSR